MSGSVAKTRFDFSINASCTKASICIANSLWLVVQIQLVGLLDPVGGRYSRIGIRTLWHDVTLEANQLHAIHEHRVVLVPESVVAFGIARAGARRPAAAD